MWLLKPLVLLIALAATGRVVAFVSLPSGRWGTSHNALTMFSAKGKQNLNFPADDSPADHHRRAISASESQSRTEVRRQRLLEEARQRERFVTGDQLHLLRKQVWTMRKELEEARQLQAFDRVQYLERAILQAQQVDAEFVYQMSLERSKHAEMQGMTLEAEKYRKEAKLARSALPQFNLDGLWVGKFGERGFELINVTYADDVLIAYKVTGDYNVRKGQISFTVDLSTAAQAQSAVLEPMELTEDAARQWGTRFLSRFAGKGQVAKADGSNAQWLEGQLILVGDFFSFAWLPVSQQVFFGRPSADLILKLLKESHVKDASDRRVRDHLQRCLDETELLDDEMEINGGLFTSHNQQDYYSKEGCFE